jgi:hypothetical protein
MPEVKASPATPDKSLSHSRCNLVHGKSREPKKTVPRIGPQGRFRLVLSDASFTERVREN